MEESQTEISRLGEFGLIDRLTKGFKPVNKSSVRGVGDDAAVMDFGDKETLVTTDLLLEGIHFDLRYVPLKHLGYKSAIVNFSDIYAMGGRPTQIVVGLGISSRFTVEHIDALYSGIRLACETYGVDLVGGDTSASVTGLIISITCMGEVEKGKAITRSGARPTDLLCVSGDLGAAYMGLQLLERECRISADKKEDSFEPAFAGKEYILERQLKPEARKDIVEMLKANGLHPTSMIDISDGLSSEIIHICKDSNVGARVYEDRIPIDYQTACMAEEFNMNLVTAAMNGGEDYELLFTLPLTDHEKINSLSAIREIGYITKPELGSALVCRDGSEILLKAQGWNAFGDYN